MVRDATSSEQLILSIIENGHSAAIAGAMAHDPACT
jgi:hypothetical protein